MGISYRRDPEGNYLVIEDESFRKDAYTLRMLECNAPGSFLKLTVKQMNGIVSLWYRVTSMHSLERMFERAPMGAADLTALLDSCAQVLEQARVYLLDPEDIILDPAYIFMSPDRNIIRFIYVPGHVCMPENSFLKLAEYILRKLDHKDPAAVEIGYGLYERISGGGQDFFSVWEELRSSAGREEIRDGEGYAPGGRGMTGGGYAPGGGDMTDGGYAPGGGDMTGADTTGGDTTGRGTSGADLTGRDMAGRRRKAGKIPGKGRTSTGSARGPRKGKGLIALVLGLILSGTVFALAVGLFKLDATQIGGLFFGLLALVWLICYRFHGRGETKINFWREDGEDEAQEEFWNALTRPEETEEPPRERQMADADAGGGNAGQSSRDREEEWIHGVTRALGETDRSERIVLVSQDVRRSRDLLLESAISLIGKSREMADVCIGLDVISRVHARIDHTDEGIFLTDLNSMNGTFVNGERLEPYQRIPVKEGDRISFATVHFKLALRDYA